MIYSYRKAEQTESEVIFKLYCLVMRGYVSEIWGWDERWQVNEFSTHFVPEDVTLAHNKSELIGYSHVDNRNGQLFLRMLVVHPHHQGKGVGKNLLESVITSGKVQSKAIALEVFKINNKAKKFYESNGFKIVGETASSFVMVFT
ncbi:MAG: GNAT family N-acetyltransferase [Methylococcaceae bacterium]